MTGIFPRDFDGGLPPNPGQPNLPAQAFLHRHRLPVDTDALYYGNGCEVRLRPHVVNSLISEIASIADRAGVGYRASSLQNLELAARYLIQRGLPHASMLVEQNPWHFAGTSDPPPACYTDWMTYTFCPRMAPDTDNNRGYVRIDLNGLGYRPLYRWDGNECKAGDLINLKPFMAAFFGGAWYIIGRIPPEFRPGAIDLWVRTDGNDATADGAKNRADRAFRTIMGAWRSVGERFMATPLFTANIKLGIPGTYEDAYIGPFGSNLAIIGGGVEAGGWGGGNRFDYKIRSGFYAGENIFMALAFTGCNSVWLNGITMLMDQAGPKASALLVGGKTGLGYTNCAFESWVSNPAGWFIDARDSICSHEGTPGMVDYFMGNGTSLAGAVSLWRSVGWVCAGQPGYMLVSTYFNCLSSYLSLVNLSTCVFGGPASNAWGGITGPQYTASTNTVFFHNSNGASGPVPGTEPGTSGTGAQVIIGG